METPTCSTAPVQAGVTVLVVRPHPDDESVATGGLLASYSARGVRTGVVICTGGEEGECRAADLDPVADKLRLRDVREQELRQACAILGVTELRLLGYRDSGMADTPANTHPEAFVQADPTEAAGRLVRIIRELRPLVVVTEPPGGLYPHPDHVMCHRISVDAFHAAAVGTLLPAVAVLPANLPNVLLMGAAGALYDVTIHYGSYLLLHLPVTGVLKAVALVVAILYLFPATIQGTPQAEEISPLTRHEWILSVVLVLTLGLWLSDGWHGIAPAWVGMGAAVFCLVPPIGLVPEEAFDQINFRSLIYMAGIIGFGSLVDASGIGGLLGDVFLRITDLEPGHNWYNFATLVGVSTALGLFTTMPGVPAVLTPLGMDLAKGAGWPILTVLMTQVIGFSTVILPYQAPALVLVMERSSIPPTAILRLLIILALLTLVVLTPLNYLWWNLLGYFAPSG